MSDVPCRSVAPLSPTKIASNWSPQASILTAAKCLYSNSIQNPLSDSLSNTDPIINLPEPRNKTQVNILHNGHALRRARSFYDKLIDMTWAWGWAQVWIVYKHCACTLVRSYARTLQNIKWWGLGKMLEHRCGLCTTIAPVRSRAHHSTRHQIRGGGNTEAWWSGPDPPPPGPGPLSRLRLSPLARLRSLETRRDWHRALSLLPRHPTLLCLATCATAKFKILQDLGG